MTEREMIGGELAPPEPVQESPVVMEPPADTRVLGDTEILLSRMDTMDGTIRAVEDLVHYQNQRNESAIRQMEEEHRYMESLKEVVKWTYIAMIAMLGVTFLTLLHNIGVL